MSLSDSIENVHSMSIFFRQTMRLFTISKKQDIPYKLLHRGSRLALCKFLGNIKALVSNHNLDYIPIRKSSRSSRYMERKSWILTKTAESSKEPSRISRSGSAQERRTESRTAFSLAGCTSTSHPRQTRIRFSLVFHNLLL